MKTLQEKQQEIDGLINVIELNNRPLSPKDSDKVEKIQTTLTDDLATLLEESKQKEMDLKIEAMNKIIKIAKKV